MVVLFWIIEGTWSLALDTGEWPNQDEAVESVC